MMRILTLRPILFAILLIDSLLIGGCSDTREAGLEEPIPSDVLPTAIALTLEANGIDLSAPTPETISTNTTTVTEIPTAIDPSPTETLNDPPTFTPTITLTAPSFITPTQNAVESPVDPATDSTPPPTSIPTNTPFQITLPPPPGEASPPAIPNARIQIFRLGELSLVTSPIEVSTQLTTENGKVVRVELWGEDGRLIARHVRTFETVPWHVARIGVDVEFETSAAAEVGRLVISSEDRFGRLIGVNSVNLILLSTGFSELNPPTALWQKIIIQEPQPNALIQGGSLIVTGRAHPNSDEHPLKIMLIGEDGKVLGHRLAGVNITIPGDYGTFIAEVPYSVSDITPALLVVLEDGQQISEIAHLSSVEVLLTP